MPNDNFEERLAGRTPSEIPDDVEQRIRDLQDEMSKLTLSDKTISGESREDRYRRERRLRALRKELDRTSRYPMAKRVRANATTVSALIGVSMLICVISFFGGTLVSGSLSTPPDIQTVGKDFWLYMSVKQYETAHQYVDVNLGLTQFSNTMQIADTQMGPISSATVIGASKSTDPQHTITYTVHRAQGGTVTNPDGSTYSVQPNDYVIILTFTYHSDTNTWKIQNYSPELYNPPKAPVTTPTP